MKTGINNHKPAYLSALVPFAVFLCLVTVVCGFSLTSLSANENPLVRDAVAMSATTRGCLKRRDNPIIVWKTRRKILSSCLISGILVETVTPKRAEALFGSDNQDRRQLELCLVSILRVLYWAQSVSKKLKAGGDEDEIKPVYIEARLGAKALLTKKIGGGANSKVYTLAKLELRDCLKDATWYAGRKGGGRKADDLQTDLIESLAAIVEFDGLETTQDPSPRSSLMLSMYNADKKMYVQRLLSERVVPVAREYLTQFDPDTRLTCEKYIQSTYPEEVPTAAPIEMKNATATTADAPNV